MNRYVLTFYKKGNMRFISHLDVQRLFRRVLYRTEVDVAFTQGFNPHQRINIVQPLSLGAEAEKDYFEIDTNTPVDVQTVCSRLNDAMPAGMAFTGCREIPCEKKNLSSMTDYSEYRIDVRSEEGRLPDVRAFISAPEVFILKKDKKTKELVRKDVKSYIYHVSDPEKTEGGFTLHAVLKAASNETLNPMNFMSALLKDQNFVFEPEDIRITRTELYALRDEELVSLFNV